MKAKEFKSKKHYNEVSGLTSVVDDNVNIVLNDLGFYEEQVTSNSNYKLNSLVEYVSPSLNKDINEFSIANELFNSVEGIKFDERIGFYTSLYAGHVSEGTFRENASSGGMGTWIFKELFEKDLIDGVIHVKRNIDINSSIMFHYDISRTVEEIKEGAKTKYYPVEYSQVIKIIKKTPGRYALIGIPSFIMAIRLLAKKDKIVNERIKFTIGLICGHQKSSKFSEALAWQVGIKPGDLKHIDFRKKLLDKPANDYGIEMTGYIDGKEVTIVKPAKELLGQNWGEGYFKLQSSDFTDDVMNETADITVGDAWLPKYRADSKGNNVIVVRNIIIDNLIKDGINAGKLNFDSVDKETIVQSQAAHYKHTHDELAYRLYRKDKKKEWRPKKRIQASNDIPFLRAKVQDIREEMSTQSHLIYKKAVELDDINYFLIEMNKFSRKYSRLYKFMIIQKLGFWGIARSIKNKLISKVFS